MTQHRGSAAEHREHGRPAYRGYLLASPTVLAAARLGEQPGPVPATGVPAEFYDLADLLTDAMRPTANLIAVRMNTDGTASFALHRQEAGQGNTTMAAMLIAEELDLPLERVRVTLADARPELLANQFTAGSSTVQTVYTPIRVAAAVVRARLLAAAAAELGAEPAALRTAAGVITGPDGRTIGYGELAERAGSAVTEPAEVRLKPAAEFTIIGKPQNRIDARAAVTGRKAYTLDLDIPGALPTMVCRPPTIRGTLRTVHNLAELRALPGVTDVVAVSTGLAVRAETFGQCVDAIRAVHADWAPGPVAGYSDETVLADLRAAEVPLTEPGELGDGERLYEVLDGDFVFGFRNNVPLEPQAAIADVRRGRATLWAPAQSPLRVRREVAALLELPVSRVDVRVQQAGGAFGGRMSADVALEAAEISAALGKPVKLMWHNTDEYRHGRSQPMCTSRIRVAHAGDTVLAFEQRHTSVATDYGFGELIAGRAAELSRIGVSAYASPAVPVFELTVNVPYRFGLATQELTEVYEPDTFPGGGTRNRFNPEVVTARELMVDRLAERLGRNPFTFRQEYLEDELLRAVLTRVAVTGRWGRPMTPGTAQGICVHREHRGANATLAEIDCRGPRPRVTKVVTVVDTGLPINPRGVEAQIQGAITEGVAQALSTGLRLRDGAFLEGDWAEYGHPVSADDPPEVQVVVLPASTGRPGGAGEFGVAAAMAATACAYARATGSTPTAFPLNHASFEAKPAVPPLPQSPTDGFGTDRAPGR